MSQVHRDHPEATEAEIEAIQFGQLLYATADGWVERRCRDCGAEFALSESLAAKSPTKWTSLCASCLWCEL
jgi:hypothetical protein